MDRTLLHEILALDGIYRILTWFDRCYLHLCIADKEGDLQPSEKVSQFGHWVKKTGWQSPGIKFADDRLLYYKTGNGWELIEKYPAAHPQITEQLKQLIQ